MTWTADIVRFRFVEAADTLLHLQIGGLKPSRTGNAWSMAVGGWDGYGADRPRTRHRPDAAAISRFEEVQEWLRLITLDDDRMMVWARAMCEADRRSFAGWCEENEIVRQTAYRRTDKAYQGIALTLCNRGVFLRHPDHDRLLQIGAVRDSETATVRPVASPRSVMAQDARPTDDPEARDLSWANKQNERRRKMLAKFERERKVA